MNRLFTALFLSATFLSACWASVTASLIPGSGTVAGAPGSAVGWGFDVTNTTAGEWVLLTGSSFNGNPLIGSYVDYLSLPTAPLYIAGPAPESTNVLQPWIPSSQLGLGEFDIDPTAPVNAAASGAITVHYSVFSQDPNDPAFDPDTATLVPDATLNVPASVNVAPEPASLALFAAGCVIFFLAGRRQRHS